MLVAGVDSSTQSTKVVLCEAADGTVIDVLDAGVVAKSRGPGAHLEALLPA